MILLAAQPNHHETPASGSLLEVTPEICIPTAEFDFSYARSSGPGGQHVNKVNSKVLLRWDIQDSDFLPDDVRDRFLQKFHQRVSNSGELLLYSQRFREQKRNLQDCLDKLRDMLFSVAYPPVPRKKTRRTRAANERRLNEKRVRAQRKQRRQRPTRED